jgi:outer membrane protein OmpA-like peptidoglycan-associated protein
MCECNRFFATMKIINTAIIVLAVSVSFLGVLPAASQEIKDHPMISRYPGSNFSYLNKPSVKEFDEITLPTGPHEKGKFTKTDRFEGKIWRLVYDNPKNRSTLEIYRNYQQALTKAGFQTLFACSADECGDAGNAKTDELGFWCVTNKIQCPEPMRYIVAKLARANGDVVAAVKVRTEDTYLIVVESKPMQTGMVTIGAKEMAADISKTGHVSIYGIYFDTDKSVIKPESKQSIAEIAKLLREQPSLRLHVVGHTDNVGVLGHNMTLSKQRAEAVVSALVNEHKIAAARLIANGVGPLAPVASNAAEEGRSKNRRVELVAQ